MLNISKRCFLPLPFTVLRNLFFFFAILNLVSLIVFGCGKILGPGDDSTCPCDSVPTISHGSGGPAVLVGSVPYGITIIVYSSTNYSEELASVTVTSCSDSFKILDLPVDTVDIITKGSHYFASKMCSALLDEGENSFSPSLVDTSYFDPYGLPRYALGKVLVEFKPGVDSLLADSILKSYGCSIRREKRIYNWYSVNIPENETVPYVIEILVMDKHVCYAEPSYIYYPCL
jgi:hypothetical protein